MRRKLLRWGLMVIVLILLLYVGVFFGVKWGWTNTAGVIDRTPLIKKTNPSWAETAEWQTLAAALEKDDVVIERVAEETGVEPQLIAAMVVPEQLRLFFSEREIFKQVFAPLKILGRQTQFSWGIAGLKQETAKQIEERDTTHLLDFQTDNHDEERFNRITDDGDLGDALQHWLRAFRAKEPPPSGRFRDRNQRFDLQLRRFGLRLLLVKPSWSVCGA
ncbi:MAG: hypothetical protein HYT48_02235 [Candidatus Vogelbacteria bacterium]|nr:hypothetical protein [Candidatus Vogelbacteria bacterium]